MYYVPFLVDVSSLDAGYGIHFDLYSKKGTSDLDVNQNDVLDLEREVNGPIVIAEPGLNVRALGADCKGENPACENELRLLNEVGGCPGCPLRVKCKRCQYHQKADVPGANWLYGTPAGDYRPQETL